MLKKISHIAAVSIFALGTITSNFAQDASSSALFEYSAINHPVWGGQVWSLVIMLCLV